MHADKRLTSKPIGVFDADRCGLFRDVFALVVLQQGFESPTFLGDAQIPPPQEVGLNGQACLEPSSLRPHAATVFANEQTTGSARAGA